MSKKKILFIIDSLCIGGAEKSLITLLSLLDYGKYEVDLQLFAFDGAFMKWLPQEVNVLPPTSWTQFTQQTLTHQLLRGTPSQWWTRIRVALGLRTRRFFDRERDYFVWQQTKHQYNTLNKVYDIAIAYGQYLPTFFALEKTKAACKVGYMNVPFLPSDSLVNNMRNVYSALDLIVAVSEDVRQSLAKSFPEVETKIATVKDPISKDFSETRAKEFGLECFQDGIPHLVTAARLEKIQKGMDILLETARILKERRKKFQWYVLGDGSYRTTMENYISKHHLENHLFLLGAQANPYPYLKHATLYVQTSRFEGYGLSIAEARLLNTPVVTTTYRGWEMQMEPGKNGIVCDLNAEAVANAIQQLLEQPEQREAIKSYLQTEPKGNPEEFEKFRKLVLQETD